MREKIEKELVERCHALVKLVDSVLLPAATEPETLVFYHKVSTMRKVPLAARLSHDRLTCFVA